jgi:hypothetical protein
VKFEIEEFNAECQGMHNGSLKADISSYGTSPYKISWTGPVTGSDSGLSSGLYLIENLDAGTYTIVVTDAGGCTASIQTSVPSAIVPVPNASANSPLCAGQTLHLSASGGATYQWTGPNNFTSNINNPAISAVSLNNQGYYYVEVTNQNGCTATDSVEVIISSSFVPVASADTPCAGNALHLQASSGSSYLWSGPGGFSSSLQNPVRANVDTSDAGFYTVTITDASGCIGSASVNALVYSRPVVTASNDGPVCQGSDVHLSVNSSDSYLWTGPDNFISFLQDPTVTNVTLSDTGNFSFTFT